MARRIAIASIAILWLVASALAGFEIADARLAPYATIKSWIVAVQPPSDALTGGWPLLATLYRQSPERAQVTMLGDSITAYGPWPQLLPGLAVESHGIPGDTSRGVLERLTRGEKTAPVVFLMIGTNDASRRLPVSLTETHIRAILAHLRGRRVFVQSTLHGRSPDQSVEAAIGELDGFERDLCRSGACTFVDLNPLLAPGGRLDPAMTIDGTHLSWPAYERWGRVIAPLARNAVAQGTRIVSRASASISG